MCCVYKAQQEDRNKDLKLTQETVWAKDTGSS